MDINVQYKKIKTFGDKSEALHRFLLEVQDAIRDGWSVAKDKDNNTAARAFMGTYEIQLVKGHSSILEYLHTVWDITELYKIAEEQEIKVPVIEELPVRGRVASLKKVIRDELLKRVESVKN